MKAGRSLSLITLQALKVGIWIVGLLGFLSGAMLLLFPRASLELPSGLAHWLLRADLSAFLDRRFMIERPIYRRHRMVGTLVLVGATASLALLVLAVGSPYSIGLRRLLGVLGFRVAVATVGAAALMLLLIGFCLIVRPSVLKGFESVANRWIAPSGSAIDLSRSILRAPRLFGALLMAAGAACLWPL